MFQRADLVVDPPVVPVARLIAVAKQIRPRRATRLIRDRRRECRSRRAAPASAECAAPRIQYYGRYVISYSGLAGWLALSSRIATDRPALAEVVRDEPDRAVRDRRFPDVDHHVRPCRRIAVSNSRQRPG